mmetsp:Transcript_5644/g.21255  ORF Transcript_5644/g.21255 Transcript_5644/m.21255 type:complete len:215 (-) Transcript_5644:493-1137(-)
MCSMQHQYIHCHLSSYLFLLIVHWETCCESSLPRTLNILGMLDCLLCLEFSLVLLVFPTSLYSLHCGLNDCHSHPKNAKRDEKNLCDNLSLGFVLENSDHFLEESRLRFDKYLLVNSHLDFALFFEWNVRTGWWCGLRIEQEVHREIEIFCGILALDECGISHVDFHFEELCAGGICLILIQIVCLPNMTSGLCGQIFGRCEFLNKCIGVSFWC